MLQLEPRRSFAPLASAGLFLFLGISTSLGGGDWIWQHIEKAWDTPGVLGESDS